MAFDQLDEEKLKERVIHINRVAKVVKGGRRFCSRRSSSWATRPGTSGVGLGKANEVPEAIRKGNDQARKNLFQVPLDGVTIPHEMLGHFGAGEVLPQAGLAGNGRHRRRRGSRRRRERGHPRHPHQVPRQREPAQRRPRDDRGAQDRSAASSRSPASAASRSTDIVDRSRPAKQQAAASSAAEATS